MYDYHTHSSFSADCGTPMQEVIEAACRKGLKEIALTDHFDPDNHEPEYVELLDVQNYHKSLNNFKEMYQGKIKVLKGVEIGLQNGDTLQKCRNEANSFDYDFIIGSFHSANEIELYTSEYFEGRSTEESYISFYSYMLDCLKQYKDYDVLGHFNIIDRYTDEIPGSSVYIDLVEEIIRLIVADGKGIEINTSSYRYGMGERTTPTKRILQLYKDLGGEIVTIGSDAHRSQDVGYHFDYAIDLMLSVGMKYLATYDNRKLTFVKTTL